VGSEQGAANRVKHGLSFETAVHVFDDPIPWIEARSHARTVIVGNTIGLRGHAAVFAHLKDSHRLLVSSIASTGWPAWMFRS
jgi:uncharacterized DUF497 family protein